jgi:large subunit ribosomal protein L30
MARLRIKMVKSTIGRPLKQKRTLRALGLRKINQVVEQEARPEIWGMIRKVSHLVEVEEVKK